MNRAGLADVGFTDWLIPASYRLLDPGVSLL